MRILVVLFFFLLSGCYDSGYQPSYIISQDEESDAHEQPLEGSR